MNILLDLDIEMGWFILVAAGTIVASVVEWRRGGSDVEALKVRMHVLEQTAATAQDWADLNIRISVNERLTEKLVREWEGVGEDAED